MNKITFYGLISGLVFMACTSLDHDYMKIQRQALVADLHCDTAMKMVDGFQISS